MNFDTAKSVYYVYLSKKLAKIGIFSNLVEAVGAMKTLAPRFLGHLEKDDYETFVKAFTASNMYIDRGISKLDSPDMMKLYDARIAIETFMRERQERQSQPPPDAETAAPKKTKKVTRTVEVDVTDDEAAE